MTKTVAKLGILSIVMITVGAVNSIRNLAATAMFGSSIIFYFFIALLLFLIPSAFVSAELASSTEQEGGIYVWVKHAFKPQWGCLAVWFQWVENLMWYPTILAFLASTIGYLIIPHFSQHHVLLVCVILVIFWLMTVANFFGINISAKIAIVASIFGLFIPMGLIIGLGVLWIVQGHPLAIHFTSQAILPHWGHMSSWVSMTGIMLSFCGIEIATVHASDVKNPEKVYPISIFISVIVIACSLLFGSLAVALVVPQAKLSFVAGIMQAFDVFLSAYHMHWLLPFMAVTLVIGGLGSVNNWIIAPTRGVMLAAQDGELPAILAYQNKHDVPVVLLIIQGVLVSIVALGFLFFQNINESYWLMTALASQLYMIMYVFMFFAIIRIRKQATSSEHVYRIPGGNALLSILVTCGICSSLATIVIGFFPPSDLHIAHVQYYEYMLISGLVIMTGLPFMLGAYAKRDV